MGTYSSSSRKPADRRHLTSQLALCQRIPRPAFSLLELILALSLIVVATALIGSLMQLYSRNFATRGDDIRREQVARAILNMIAEDIRAVVLEQEYDPSVLEQLMGSGGGSGSGQTTSLAMTEETVDPTGSSLASSSMTSEESVETVVTARAPGIYGDQYSLMVDVSRLPRADEYIIQQASIMDGSLTDVPGDLKTVTYYVQTETNLGVNDALQSFADPSQISGYTSGLVRRQLDRAIIAYAEETADTQRLMATGDLVAPEVIALEFSYFDGVEWLLQWDSSSQSLPWLIQISLAMQSASASEDVYLEPGTPISTMPYADRQAYGIEVYELVVAIPGAQITAGAAMSEDQAAGMDSLGL